MGKQRTAAERRREVAGWRASGESARAYAERRGYSTTSLLRWAAAERAAAPQFVRVEVVGREAHDARARELVVEVGEARVRVGADFDAELLRAVVSTLSRRSS